MINYYCYFFFIRATDADEGKNAAIRYVIIGGNTQAQFLIDSLTGDVILAKPLDYEVLKSYRLVIRAQGKEISFLYLKLFTSIVPTFLK